MTPQQDEWLDQLRRRYQFAEWGTPTAAGPTLAAFELPAGSIPGWELVRSRRLDALTPPREDFVWRRPGGGDTLLRVSVTRCESAAAAREQLLRTLGDFESAIPRRTDLGLGDVAFGLETVLVFVRANIVVLVGNAGRDVVPVLEPAGAVDARLADDLRKSESR